MAKLKLGQKLKKFIGTVAPTLGTAFGGPLGAMAGGFVQNALGVDSDEAALTLLQSDPEALGRLKQAERDFEAKMAELDVDLEKLHQVDRASARQMASSTSIMPQIGLSILFVVGYFVVLGLFFSQTLVVPMNEAFMVMLGVLTAGVPQVMSFWLGSSSGSSKKTDILAKNEK